MKHLIKKAQSGDAEAYLELFQIYEKDIYRMAFSYSKNKNDALDIVQETAFRSFKSIKKVKQVDYFKTWLLKITINVAIDLLNKEKRITNLQYQDPINFYSNDDEINYLENTVIEKITMENLLEKLSIEEKTIVILRFYHDLSLKSISEVMNLSLSTVKSLLYRTLKKLNTEEGGKNNEQIIRRTK